MNICDLLKADHRDLDALFDKVFDAAASDDRELTFSTLDLFWARLAMHIRAEHLCLFPAIRDAAEGCDTQMTELLDRLRHDHDFFMTELARAIKALRLTNDPANEGETLQIVRTIITAVRVRLVEHDSIEEELVYPAADDAADAHELAANVRRELDNYPARFV